MAVEREVCVGLKKAGRFGSSRVRNPTDPIRLDPSSPLVLAPPLLHLHYLPGLGLESIKKSSSLGSSIGGGS